MRANDISISVVLVLAAALPSKADEDGNCYVDYNTTANCDVLKCQEYWGSPPTCIRWGIEVGVWNVLFVPKDSSKRPQRCQMPLGAWPGDARSEEGLTAWQTLGDLPAGFDCGTPYVPGTEPAGVEPGGTNYTREDTGPVLGIYGWQDEMSGVCGMPMCRAAVGRYLEPGGCRGSFCSYGKCKYAASAIGYSNAVCFDQGQSAANGVLKMVVVILLAAVACSCICCGVLVAYLKYNSRYVERVISFRGPRSRGNSPKALEAADIEDPFADNQQPRLQVAATM
mmetsp:Transcript_45683/g.118173  ORF Transcript_45683/g.118173 Transcript_45683/m.118173 type:complete len:282 (-) Transcript_45683:191-1036(-)